MNGRQVADVARTKRPGLRILFITGYAEKPAAGRGFGDEDKYLLANAFTLEAWGARIRQIIES